MKIGKITKALASNDTPSPEAHAAIREALGPVVADLRHEFSLVGSSLGGPDPEYALYLFTQIVREVPGSLRKLEAGLRGEARS